MSVELIFIRKAHLDWIEDGALYLVSDEYSQISHPDSYDALQLLAGDLAELLAITVKACHSESPMGHHAKENDR